MHSRIRQGIAWAIIIGTVLFSNWPERRRARAEREDPLWSPQFALQCRYVVGMSHLLSSMPNARTDQAAKVAAAARGLAKTPVEQLRLTAVIGELQGPDAALGHLRSVEPQLHDPELVKDAALFQKIYAKSPDGLAPAEQERIRTRHGFAGRLALSFNRLDTDPLRREVLKAAKQTALAAIGVLVIALGGLFIGLVLLIIGIVFVATGKLRRRYERTSKPAVMYLECFAIYFLGMIGLSLIFQYVLKVQALWPSSLFLLLPGVLLLYARRCGLSEMARVVGFVPSARQTMTQRGVIERVVREMGAGILGYISGLPVMAMGLLMTMILMKFAKEPPTHPIINYAGQGPRVTLQLYLLACGVAPMVEETFFRGAFYAYLRSRFGYVISAMVSSLIFALIHPQGWAAVPVLTAIGFVLASIRESRHSLLGPMTAHAMNNFIATTFLTFALG